MARCPPVVPPGPGGHCQVCDGGVWVLPLVSSPLTYLLAIIVGSVITGFLVIVLMAQRQKKLLAADDALEAAAAH